MAVFDQQLECDKAGAGKGGILVSVFLRIPLLLLATFLRSGEHQGGLRNPVSEDGVLGLASAGIFGSNSNNNNNNNNTKWKPSLQTIAEEEERVVAGPNTIEDEDEAEAEQGGDCDEEGKPRKASAMAMAMAKPNTQGKALPLPHPRQQQLDLLVARWLVCTLSFCPSRHQRILW